MQPNTVTTSLKSKADTAIRKVEQTVHKYEYLVLNETDFGLSAALCSFYETKKTLIATTPPGGDVTTIKPSYQEVLEKHQALILLEIIPTWTELNDTLFKNIIFNSPALDSVAAFVSNALPFTSFEGELMLFIPKFENLKSLFVIKMCMKPLAEGNAWLCGQKSSRATRNTNLLYPKEVCGGDG